MVNDIDMHKDDDSMVTFEATLNTGKKVLVDSEHSLYLEPAQDNIAALRLDHGLSALFSRSAWYRLVEMSELKEGRACIVSAGEIFPIEVET